MMKSSVFILLTIFVVANAKNLDPYNRPVDSDCVSLPQNSSSEASLFPSEYMLPGQDVTSKLIPITKIVNAVGFDVEYHQQYKVVTNHIANETYVLYQCGSQLPPTSQFPEGTKFFQIPLTSISAPETVPYAFLELLGLDDRVYDVSPYVTSPCGQKILACNHTSVEDHSQLSNTSMLESTIGSDVDSVLATEPHPYSKTFSFSAAQDPGLLNRAEWIKFLGLFFNREKYASDIFDGIAKEYSDTKAAAAAASAAAEKNTGKIPTVAIATHYVYEKDESYQLDWAPYKLNLTADAGAQPLDYNTIAAIDHVRPSAFSNTTLEFAWDGKKDSFPTKEAAHTAFLQALSSADIVLDETYTPTPRDYNYTTFENEYGINATTEQEKKALTWLSKKLIFREDGLVSPTGGSDVYEGALARPAKLLADIYRAVDASRDPAALERNYTWIRQIDEPANLIDASACTRLTSDCHAPPAPICPFVSFCPDGKETLLIGDVATQTTCTYESCADAASLSTLPAANTAQMAAPAVILLTVLIVFVEALINFC